MHPRSFHTADPGGEARSFCVPGDTPSSRTPEARDDRTRAFALRRVARPSPPCALPAPDATAPVAQEPARPPRAQRAGDRALLRPRRGLCRARERHGEPMPRARSSPNRVWSAAIGALVGLSSTAILAPPAPGRGPSWAWWLPAGAATFGTRRTSVVCRWWDCASGPALPLTGLAYWVVWKTRCSLLPTLPLLLILYLKPGELPARAVGGPGGGRARHVARPAAQPPLAPDSAIYDGETAGRGGAAAPAVSACRCPTRRRSPRSGSGRY